MEKATVTKLHYEKGDTKEKQGTYRDMKKFLDNGYYKKEERNGYWVLVKPPVAQVTLSIPDASKTYNIKEELKEHYGKTRFTENLFRTFQNDLNAGKISFEMNAQGEFALI